MLRFAIVCLFMGAISAAQTPIQPKTAPSPAGPAAPTASTAAPSASVADTQPVITIHGLCPSTAARTSKTAAKKGTGTPAAGCTTTITKAQLEKLIGILNTNNQPLTPQVRRQFAQSYAELLTYGASAEKAGIDDAKFADLMRFVRLRTLVTVYKTRLDEQAHKPADKDIQAYYDANKSKYEEVKLSRIYIPAKNTAAQDKDAAEKKAADVSQDVHDRAQKGEDMDKLQKESYTTLGLTISPPNTTMGMRRRGTLPKTEEDELFSLKPGDVSKVEQDATGYSIYKVENRDTIPLDKVKDEISRELAREKMEATNKEINAGIRADLNEAYFGPAVPPPSVVSPAGPRPNIAPPAPQPAAHPAPQPQPAATPAAPKN